METQKMRRKLFPFLYKCWLISFPNRAKSFVKLLCRVDGEIAKN